MIFARFADGDIRHGEITMITNVAFAVGDTVRMKSGGHEMTVRGFEKTDSTPVAADHHDAHVRTEWMSEDGKIHAHVFSRAMLDGVKDNREDGKAQPAPARDDGASGVNRTIVRQDAATTQHQERSWGNDPRVIPGGVPQNKVAPPPDRLWNEDSQKTDQAPNEDKQGRQFNSPAHAEGAGGGPGGNTH